MVYLTLSVPLMFHPFSLNLKGRLLEVSRPMVMGIVNVTPDSFYSESRTMDERSIGKRIEEMISDGVDIIDMGAYSSRPGASDVAMDEELSRLRMGMKILRSIDSSITVSIDTFRAKVAKSAVEEMGADIINDISGGNLDDEMFEVVSRLGVPYILMHMRGTPETMQQMCDYHDVTADVIKDLSEKLRKLHLLGVSDVIVDPGFGFSKTVEQNFEIMKHLDSFSVLDSPLLVGVSRKSMITKTLGITADEALAGTVALGAIALTRGASILRVHDVKSAVESVRLYELSTL